MRSRTETVQERNPQPTDNESKVVLGILLGGLATEAFVSPDTAQIISVVTLGAAAVSPFIRRAIGEVRGT